jgi:predicted TIM-barrel fold metal-dependent hydrolase
MPQEIKIDAHVHVFTTDMPLIDNPRHAPTYSFTHEELIQTLDQNGVERAVIAAASPGATTTTTCSKRCARIRSGCAPRRS